MKPEEEVYSIEGVRIAVRRWRLGTRPLLALHGWMDNAATWENVAPMLHGFDVVCVDLPGHGLSDWRQPATRYHTVDYLFDIHALVSALSWQTFSLMGHSMGAGLATLYAGIYPERIEKLILVEGLGPFSGQAEETPSLLRDAIESWQNAGNKERVLASFEQAVELRQKGIGVLSKEASSILCARGVEPVSGGWRWRTDKRLKLTSGFRWTEEQIMAVIQNISAPTLVVMGEQGFGQLHPDRTQRRFAALRAGTRCDLAGGHHLHLEKESAVLVARRIVEFL